MVKICPQCNIEKEINLENFAKSSKIKSGFQTNCRECNKKKCKKYYNLSREKRVKDSVERTKKRRIKQKEWIDSLKIKCCSCDETDSVCLDFHHIRDKVEIICKARRRFGLEKIKEEIEKCIVLCSNCHRKFHAERFCLWPRILKTEPPNVSEAASYQS